MTSALSHSDCQTRRNAIAMLLEMDLKVPLDPLVATLNGATKIGSCVRVRRCWLGAPAEMIEG